MTTTTVPVRRILRRLPVVRRVDPNVISAGLFVIVGYSRDPDPRAYNASYRDWAPVWLALPDGRRFITEAWVLT